MNEGLSDNLFFTDDIRSFNFTANIDMLVHILCLEGSFSFTRNHIRFNGGPATTLFSQPVWE